MEEIDYSIESEDEAEEDAFVVAPSDNEIKELLAIARKEANIKLRRALKELLYVRWIITHLTDFIEDNNESDLLTIQKLAKNYANGVNRANKQD
jgi:hypothetical protein